MEVAVDIYTISTLTSLVNSSNLLTIFITLMVVFFLLGLLLGLNIITRRNRSDSTTTTTIENSRKSDRQTPSLGQEDWERTQRNINTSYPKSKHSRHRHQNR